MSAGSPSSSPRLAAFLQSSDPEGTFVAQVTALIAEHRGGAPRQRRPGDPLRLLLVGYSGGGNTGADVRVAEIIRQIRTILRPEQVQIGLTLVGEFVPPGLFSGAEPVAMQGYAVDFLASVATAYDGMLPCEGSMFKSKNSNIFSALMAGALGVADAQRRLAIGYGGDAGPMDPVLRELVAGLGTGPLVLARAPESAALLGGIGLRTTVGADTAWTYEPATPEQSQSLLQAHGWSRGQPVLIVCPVNPFWWPVRTDPAMAEEMERTGAHKDSHYGSVFFHTDSEERRSQYRRYIAALATAARAWRDRTGGFVAIVGMERIDRRACADLAERLPFATPQILSGEHPVGAIVGMLRCADLLISSRYHAIVTSMPALVPALGVSMDERISSLLRGYGAEARLLQVNDPLLGDRLVEACRKTRDALGTIAEATGREVVRQLHAMGRMGRDFAAEVSRVYPDIEVPPPQTGWERFVPELSPALQALLLRYG